jgi:hypothetical protein
MVRRPRVARVPLLVGAAALLSCVCCVGGLLDALPTPYRLGLAIAAVLLAVAAVVLGVTRTRRRFRAVRSVVVGYLDDVLAGDVESSRRWLTGGGTGEGPAEFAIPATSTLTAYRIVNAYADFLSPIVTVTVQLRFDNHDQPDRYLQLLVVEDGRTWRIVRSDEDPW